MHFGSDLIPVGDAGDTSISERLMQQVREGDCRVRFLKDIKTCLNGVKIDLISVTGDFGWQYEHQTIEHGIEYLSSLAKTLAVPSGNVVVCPGNHDLNRLDPGREFKRFIDSCSNKGFTLPGESDVARVEIKGIPFIALNSCLGGTEHALHGVPDAFWRQQKDLLKSSEDHIASEGLIERIEQSLKHQIQAMDIPALGLSQIDQCSEILLDHTAKVGFVLLHHNPLPSSSVDIRPYANLVDSGRLITKLQQIEKDVFILHGHTHINSTSTLYASNELKRGSIVTISNNGLSGNINSSASVIEVLLDNESRLIRADVNSIERIGDVYQKGFEYRVRNSMPLDNDIVCSLRKLEGNHRYTFSQVCDTLGIHVTDESASKLLLAEGRGISIDGDSENTSTWSIFKNG